MNGGGINLPGLAQVVIAVVLVVALFQAGVMLDGRRPR